MMQNLKFFYHLNLYFNEIKKDFNFNLFNFQINYYFWK